MDTRTCESDSASLSMHGKYLFSCLKNIYCNSLRAACMQTGIYTLLARQIVSLFGTNISAGCGLVNRYVVRIGSSYKSSVLSINYHAITRRRSEQTNPSVTHDKDRVWSVS